MKTSLTPQPDSRVRIEAEVDAHAVDHAVEHAAEHLADDMRIPGFRKGKVPPRLVIQRLGYATVFDAAMREFLSTWYEQAVIAEDIRPLGDPKFDVERIPLAGQPFEFSFEVAVTPKAQLGEYKGLEIGRGEAKVPDEAVDAELDRLRDGFSSLAPVERAAAVGDVVLIDFAGTVEGEPFEGSAANDFTVSMTEDDLSDEFRDALTGASAGDERDVELDFPDDHQDPDLAGKQAKFVVKVKEVRERIRPELDDDFAIQASEFDTLEELRSSIIDRLAHSLEHQVEDEYRRAVIDTAAANVIVDLPEDLVRAHAEESLDRLERNLAARGIDPATYFRIQEKSREELLEESLPDAENALRRESLLEAVVEAEGIAVTEEEMIEALTGQGDGPEPTQLLEELRANGRDKLLIRDLRTGKAADFIVDSAKPVPLAEEAAEPADATG